MRRFALIAAVLLVGCGQKGAELAAVKSEAAHYEAAPAVEAMPEEAAPPTDFGPTGSPDTAAQLAAPQIAYSYTRRYRTPVDGIAALQARHIALCDKAGRAACHILSQRIAEADSGEQSQLELSVAANKANDLLAALDKAAAGNGSEMVASGIEAEDLGTRIFDVEARLRAKQALVDRLLVIIRSRTGSIKEVVAAEQAFAEAQGDLEAAQAELALMRRQVARSTITLDYAAPAGVRSSFTEGLRPAFDDAGALLGESLAALVRFLIVGLPWLVVIGLPLGWLWRRRRARKAASDKPPHDMTAA